MNLKVKVKGVNKVRSGLRKYEKRSGDNVRRVIARTTLAIEGDAKRNCRVRTGRLRAGNRSEITNNGFTGRVINNVEYAVFEEFGTRNHGGHPFMRPSFDKNTRYFPQDIKKAL